MQRSYVLGIFAPFHPKGLSHAWVSTSVNGHVLADAFECLNHVKVTMLGRDVAKWPKMDVALVHHYLEPSNRIFMEARSLQGQRCPLLASYLEVTTKADVSFVFLPENVAVWGGHPLYFPFDDKNLKNVPKDTNAYLLDHSWPEYKDERWQDEETVLTVLREVHPNAKVCKFAFSRRDVAAPKVSHDDLMPSWVDPIPPLPYLEYLDRTKQFGTFIVTHHGSFNHTIVDMAARGIRVISSKRLIAQSMIGGLGVQTYDDANGLRRLLTSPVTAPVLGNAISISAAVKRMDQTFINSLRTRG